MSLVNMPCLSSYGENCWKITLTFTHEDWWEFWMFVQCIELEPRCWQCLNNLVDFCATCSNSGIRYCSNGMIPVIHSVATYSYCCKSQSRGPTEFSPNTPQLPCTKANCPHHQIYHIFCCRIQTWLPLHLCQRYGPNTAFSCSNGLAWTQISNQNDSTYVQTPYPHQGSVPSFIILPSSMIV